EYTPGVFMQTFALNDRKVINGWALFDWANSAYFLVIATAVFPPYFDSVTPDQIRFLGGDISNTALYAYAVSFAYLLVAVLSPLLSGIADYGGRRKYFMKLFTAVGGIACIALFFFATEDLVWLGTTMFILATIGAAGGIVFYNAYLPEIVTEDMYDKVSAKGYIYGYFGSVLLLICCLVMILKPEWFGISSSTLPARISFALVGIWWIGFAQITFRRLPPDRPVRSQRLLAKGLQELRSVWNKVKHQPRLLRFLASFFFYMAGVQTVIYLATIFAQNELNFGSAELIAVVLILQLVAMLGAWLFAKVSDKHGNKTSLLIQIAIWMLICVAAYFVQDKMQFYVIAGFVGMVLGGIQSLSRSTYAKLLEDRTQDLTSYFSFYDVLFKVSLVAGSFIFGFVDQVTGGMRNSVLALIGLFVIGMILMWTVDMRDLRRAS
ncbi:MAG: MFS transporter, partial [Saprospiraceae bacterium]|nr:MFS transporter [Saprospiraceae bacterium]